ncbi:antitoxin [Streptomyces sp. Qhu_M48]|uniref:antitoxin n=1 Tax=Streptomyces sp. Qhu_M48 TaxID=3435889 RepID=UPI003F502D10
MSVFDKLKGMLKGHEDQASKGVDKAGDYVDGKTQGKYAGQVDTAQEKLRQQMGGTRQGPDSPPPPPPPSPPQQ